MWGWVKRLVGFEWSVVRKVVDEERSRLKAWTAVKENPARIRLKALIDQIKVAMDQKTWAAARILVLSRARWNRETWWIDRWGIGMDLMEGSKVGGRDWQTVDDDNWEEIVDRERRSSIDWRGLSRGLLMFGWGWWGCLQMDEGGRGMLEDWEGGFEEGGGNGQRSTLGTINQIETWCDLSGLLNSCPLDSWSFLDNLMILVESLMIFWFNKLENLIPSSLWWATQSWMASLWWLVKEDQAWGD